MKKKIYSLLGVLAIFLMVPLNIALAQEKSVAEQIAENATLEIIAEVNIRNAKIVSQSGNSFEISFDLTNDRKVQPQVRYSVQLFEKPSVVTENEGFLGKLVDEKIYDEVINLGEFDSETKTIHYDAPEFFTGKYNLLINSQNNDGMIFALAPLGEVELKGKTADFVNLDVAKCSMMVANEKYSLNFGVDVDNNEELRLECDATSYYSGNVNASPVIKTYSRTVFGEEVSISPVSETFAIKKGEGNKISFVINKADKAQSYESVLYLADGNDNVISNSIVFRYVLRGNSASIQNARLDKDRYMDGETAVASIVIASSADNFPAARKQGDTNRKVILNIEVEKNNGEKCSEKFTKKMDNYAPVEARLPIMENCEDPVLSVVVTDENGNILDEEKFYVETKAEAKEGEREMIEKAPVDMIMEKVSNSLIFILAAIPFIGLIIYLVVKKKKKNMIVPMILFLFGIFGFVGANEAEAYTYAVTSQDCSLSVSVNLDKSTYKVNEAMTASASSIKFDCCNNNNADASVAWDYPGSGTTVALLTSGSRTYSTAYSSHEFGIVSYSSAGSVTKTADVTSGSYNSPFIFNVHTYYPFHPEYGESQRAYVANVPYTVAPPPVNGACNTANATNFASTTTAYPSTSFCTAGTASPVSPTFPSKGGSTTWTCSGTNGGTSASCTAKRKVDCGTNATNFSGSITSWPSGGTFCGTGTTTINPASPTFPSEGSSTTWSCVGSNGLSTSCTASRGACTPQEYTCYEIGSDGNDCNALSNCEKTHETYWGCAVKDSCGAIDYSQSASVCNSNGTSCSATTTETCPDCPDTTNWTEVNP